MKCSSMFYNLSSFFSQPDNETVSKRPESVASSVDCKDNDLDNKNRDSMEIKRESSIHLDDDFHSLPPLKRLRADYVDAESNTTNSGKSFTKKGLKIDK